MQKTNGHFELRRKEQGSKTRAGQGEGRSTYTGVPAHELLLHRVNVVKLFFQKCVLCCEDEIVTLPTLRILRPLKDLPYLCDKAISIRPHS